MMVSQVSTPRTLGMATKSIVLPDEIIIQIIRFCVEPYDLQVHQHTFNTHTLQREVSGYEWMEFCEKYKDNDSDVRREYSQHYHSGTNASRFLPVRPSTALVVAGFTRTGEVRGYQRCAYQPEYLCGIPKVVNVKLVNKIFLREVQIALKMKFTGKISILGEEEFFRELARREVDWTLTDPASCILEAKDLAWLNPLVTTISVACEHHMRSILMCPLFNKAVTPNLKRVILRHPYGETLPVGTDLQDTGNDSIIMRGVFKWFSLKFTAQNCRVSDDLPYLRQRNVKVVIEVEMATSSPGRASRVQDVNKTFMFTFDVTDPNKFTIESRRKL